MVIAFILLLLLVIWVAATHGGIKKSEPRPARRAGRPRGDDIVEGPPEGSRERGDAPGRRRPDDGDGPILTTQRSGGEGPARGPARGDDGFEGGGGRMGGAGATGSWGDGDGSADSGNGGGGDGGGGD